MTDLRPTIAPKSDQLNADDLIGGARNITVTGVSANPSSAEQPINIFFDGDNGKPYKPCKSMRRVMVHVWGPDGKKYVGRSMTIYCDPSVTWGGVAVGGVRISHMSDIDSAVSMALTANKKQRKPYKVMPLEMARQPEINRDGILTDLRITASQGSDALEQAWGLLTKLERKALAGDLPDLKQIAEQLPHANEDMAMGETA